MEFRNISSDDLDALAEVYVKAFNAPPWNDGWTILAACERLSRFVITEGSYGVVAQEDGVVLGFALGRLERWIDGEHFHLKEMCVTPERQRSGVGSRILDALTSRLTQLGVSAVYLETLPHTQAAMFYERHG